MDQPANLPLTTLRDASVEDAEDVTRLVQELAASGGERSPIDERYARYFLSQSNCHILLAEVEDQIIGLLSYLMKPDLYHASDTCYIAELIVKDGYRDRGVGSLLMKKLIELMVTSGCVEISVTTMPYNRGAIEFYKKHGLVDEGVLLERHFIAE